MARLGSLAPPAQWIAWSLSRWLRLAVDRVGWPGVAAATLAVVAAAAWAWSLSEGQRMAELQAQLAKPSAAPRFEERTPHAVESRLQAFHALLVSHDDIPVVIQDLLALGEKLELRMPKAEYRLDPDAQGGFARYRMVMPVKGEAEAVQRFLASALADHKSLALEAVQFKRESVATRQVEARIQWTLMVKASVDERRTMQGLKP